MKRYDPLGPDGNNVGDSVEPTATARVDVDDREFMNCFSRITPDFLINLQEEIANAVEDNEPLDGEDRSQLLNMILASATAAADLAVAAVPVQLVIAGTPNGTAATDTAAILGSVTMAPPGGRKWQSIYLVWSTQVLSTGGIAFDSVEISTVTQTTIGVKHAVTAQNSDDHMVVPFMLEFIPTSTGTITVDFLATKNGATIGDSTGERQMYAVGRHVPV